MRKIMTLIFIILFASVSCSRLDLAVNLANSYIAKKTDDFFDLTWDQKSWLKEVLTSDISQIKKTIFPLLASEMLKIAELLGQQKVFDSKIVMTSYNRLEEIYYEGLKILSPTAIVLIEKLSPAQIEYFQKETDKKFLEMKDDSNDKSYKKMKKNFDSWMGGITSRQKEELKQFIEKNPTPIKDIIHNRQTLTHEFVKVYPDKVARKLFIERIFTNYSGTLSSDHKKIIDEKNNKVAVFFTHVLNTMPDNQKQTLINTIRDRANQIIKISKN